MKGRNDETNNSAAPASNSRDEESSGDQLSTEQMNYAVQFLTTEHFTLQTARSATISDSSGRASLFMSTVSSSLIALAFVGQISQAGTAFTAFALVLFPTLFFLGLVTFQRVLQSSIEDNVYASGINRIRHFYIEVAPQTSKYYILSANDDATGVMGNMSVRPGRWQVFLTTAGTILVINSILLGVLTGLVMRAFTDAPLLWIMLGGLFIFGLSLAAHYAYQVKQWSIAVKQGSTIFPSDTDRQQANTKANEADR